MNVYSPKRLFDWRVSVSLEIPSGCFFVSLRYARELREADLPDPHPPAPVPEGALTSTPARVRYKDRISYSHQLCQVDLTKVQTGSPMAPPTHELEVEIRNAKQLLEEAAKDQRGEENRYLEMVQVLLNNIRGSSRPYLEDNARELTSLVFRRRQPGRYAYSQRCGAVGVRFRRTKQTQTL